MIPSRLLLALAACWMFAALPARAPAPAAPPPCPSEISDDLLARHLHRFDDYAAGFEEKMRTGYYRSGLGAQGPFGILSRKESLGLLRDKLARLSRDAPTALLVVDAGCAILVTPEGGAHARPVSLPAGAVERLRANLGVEARARGPETAGPSRQAAFVVAPAAPRPAAAGPALADLSRAILGDLPLGAHRRLLVLAGNDLGRIPMAALTPAGADRPLGLTHALVFAPNTISLTNPEAVKPARRPSRALVVGDPDLSHDTRLAWPRLAGAEREAAFAAGRLDGELLAGADATKAAVRRGVIGRDYLHFATHAVSDGVNPMDESLVALAGGHLLGREVKSLSLAKPLKPLVVLSACQTGLGKVFTGGTFGPVRAWYHAGASQVVASMWNVDDAETSALMRAFVEAVAVGRGAEFALRDAMAAAHADHPDDPAVWASFYVFGEPSSQRGASTSG
ncbi:MAG TPA: CHAT domain-containing protein [Caulobacteraceae bacterium]|nr:CHAT domain-containing protein [Caulobacteraceae bacterium]